MNKTLLFISLSILSLSVSAQKIKDQVGGMIPKQKQEEAAPATSTGTASNQYEEVKKFNAVKKHTHFERASDGKYNENKFNGATVVEVLKSSMKFDDKGNVTSFMHKGIEFVPNHTVYPMFFRSKSNANTPNHIVFANGCMYQGYNYDVNTGKFSKPVDFMTGEKLKSADVNDSYFDQQVANYHAAVKPEFDKQIAAEKSASDQAAAEARAKGTTKDKAVTKIEIDGGTSTMKQGESYVIHVTATLKDGSKISTGNGGYADEYEFIFSGVPESTAGFLGAEKTVFGNTVKVPMDGVVQGDKITVTVKSKFHPSLSATKSYTMDYTSPVDVNYNAEMRSDRNRVYGSDLRVEIKSVKHAVTSKPLLEYKVINVKDGRTLKHFRVEENVAVTVQTCGQKGWGAQGSQPAQDGTKGGDVTVVTDPSVKTYNLTIRNTGGAASGGMTTKGADGKVEKIVQKVNW